MDTFNISEDTLNSIEHILDKLNITLEISKAELLNYINSLEAKIITYEIIMNILAILICIVILIALISFEKKGNRLKKDIKACKDSFNDSKDNNTKALVNCAVALFIAIMESIRLVIAITNLVMCFVFPEKIILEFIARYI